MRTLFVAAALTLLPLAAFAQQVPQPSPQDQVQALSGQLIDEMQQILQWRTRALADEATIAKLQEELAKKK